MNSYRCIDTGYLVTQLAILLYLDLLGGDDVRGRGRLGLRRRVVVAVLVREMAALHEQRLGNI